MAGNREQVRYAMERLDEIANAKRKIITDECTDKAASLTAEKLVALIKSGAIKLRTDRDSEEIDGSIVGTYYTSRIENIFDISKYQKGPKVDKAKVNKRVEKLQAEVTRIKDQLMLGDLKVALDLVEKFQSARF